MSENIIEAVQKEVARIRERNSTIKALLPDGRVNFIIYDIVIERAEKAIREQDTVALIEILHELKRME